VSYARRSRDFPEAAGLATFVILTASGVVFFRVLAIIGATGPGFVPAAWPPLALMGASLIIMAGASWWTNRQAKADLPEQGNPSELKTAVLFALVYAVVLMAVAAARDHFGDRGLYAVAALSGLTDMDAITLSVTQLVNAQQVTEATGWRLILVAALSNLMFKAGAVAVLGSRRLFARVALLFSASFAVGWLLLWLWPA
jgi:uncharacterized membrane protein (DUF4010 family)